MARLLAVSILIVLSAASARAIPIFGINANNNLVHLYDGNGTRIIFNDNWTDDSSQAAALTANGLAPTSAEESGIFTTLPPGSFTAILAGKNGGIGVGLVEVYNLQ